jgi:chromosome segregation ATPase
MSSIKDLKLAQKAANEQRQVILELKTLVKDIERCEKTIVELKQELENVNSRHQGRRTTREDIAYLTDLLECAKKKLAWEKNIASLQKRTPQLLDRMLKLINDPQNPPSEESRAGMLGSLQAVQAAMERLQNVKAD